MLKSRKEKPTNYSVQSSSYSFNTRNSQWFWYCQISQCKVSGEIYQNTFYYTPKIILSSTQPLLSYPLLFLLLYKDIIMSNPTSNNHIYRGFIFIRIKNTFRLGRYCTFALRKYQNIIINMLKNNINKSPPGSKSILEILKLGVYDEIKIIWRTGMPAYRRAA